MNASFARIETVQGHRWWKCPNCGQKMGEVVGQRVIISVGDRQIRMPSANQPEQDCPRCGQSSVLEDVAA
jgi:ribosomal protein S27AE